MTLKNLLRRLDLTTLQLFLAIHEEGTLTRASEREAIAVSAASKRLLELEQAVGAVLFERKARGMSLTPAGETLLHHARRVLRDIENIGIELAEHATGVRGYVRMMANLSAIVEFLPEDLRAFLSIHDRIKIELEERPSGGIMRGGGRQSRGPRHLFRRRRYARPAGDPLPARPPRDRDARRSSARGPRTRQVRRDAR